MKKLMILISIILFSLSFSNADEVKKEEKNKAESEFFAYDESSKQTAENNDSTKKSDKKKEKCKKVSKDKFVDKDADGINDKRCKGMGLKHCKNPKCKKKCCHKK